MPKVGMEPIRKKQVVNATLECISEFGFERLTIESVAKKAGISKGVVSYYFKGKEDLILQSFRAFLEHYNQKAAEAMESKASALKMLESMIDIVVFPKTAPQEAESLENALKNQDKNKIVITIPEDKYFGLLIHFYSYMKQTEKLQAVYQEVYQQYLDGVIAILEYGIEKKEFKFVNLLPTAYSILAQIDGIILYEALGFQPLGKREVKKAYKAFIRDLLT
ncbi:MAG: TetR family transcriptional regulator [Desulfobacteraceae bacterium]|nr:TetR family transcriptional regulator [Desulfobacteraceae bacterium]